MNRVGDFGCFLRNR